MTQDSRRQRQLLDLANQLGANPLFQLSTANQELFHSNMLHWLALNASTESSGVWGALFGDGIPRIPRSSERERANIDLLVSFPDYCVLAVENKIHSIATEKQLNEYAVKLGAGASQNAYSFTLLSLFSPIFPSPAPWKPVRYDDLLVPLGETADRLAAGKRVADSHVVRRYRDLIALLVELRDLVDPIRFSELPLELDSGVDKVLAEHRLLPLVRKSSASRVMEELAGRLRVSSGDSEAMCNDRVELSAGMSRSTGIMSMYVTIPSGPNHGRRIGWQVQASQFRLVAIARERDRIRAVDPTGGSPLAQEFPGYFDLNVIQVRNQPVPSRSRKTWCKYGDGFVYQYGKLPQDTTAAELIELCEKMTQRALTMAERFSE